MTQEQQRQIKRAAFAEELNRLVAKHLGADPSLNDYEALVTAMVELAT
ncbi:hypothetical protein JQ553_34140 [Bradyrhizobium lablabi]|nr:hypothetical protein [Bradyrhizobium lablabi]